MEIRANAVPYKTMCQHGNAKEGSPYGGARPRKMCYVGIEKRFMERTGEAVESDNMEVTAD